MHFNIGSIHGVIDLLFYTVFLFKIILFVRGKSSDKTSNNFQLTVWINNKLALASKNVFHRDEYEKKFLATMKDLQDLKFALDESNLVQIVDKHANILYANEQFCHLSEYTFQELKGKNMRLFNSNFHPNEYFQELWITVSQGRVWRGEMRNKTKSGKHFWVNTTIVPFLDKDKKPFQYIVIRNDITKSKENERKLKYLSNVDGLTSLYNRRYFDTKLDYYWEFLSERKNWLSVILFDVDYFKFFNDHYGHIMGDQCLIEISIRVKESLSTYEAVCARYGGEEFAIILPNKDSYEASFIAEMIRSEIEHLNIPHNFSKTNKWVTMSFGVASVVPSPNMEPKKLLELADKALYQAKNNGRNTVFHYEENVLKETFDGSTESRIPSKP